VLARIAQRAIRDVRARLSPPFRRLRSRKPGYVGQWLSSMAKKSPSAIDRQVGVRVRMRRVALDMSQEKLAAQLGVSFQQVQKYEKGVNRIGAGRLQQLAEILQAPVGFFFEDFPTPRGRTAALPSYISDFLTTADGLALSRAFMGIRDPRERRCIVILAEAMAR
jgi:transcriptional regulator with XRE-family HTH domain